MTLIYKEICIGLKKFHRSCRKSMIGVMRTKMQFLGKESELNEKDASLLVHTYGTSTSRKWAL